MSSDLLQFHAFCLTDTGTRLDHYAGAIRHAVRPGNVVVDVGAGTGILSFLAAVAGAQTVYAIEASDALSLGQLLKRTRGPFDRIQFMRGSSTEITLPQRADVIVADIHDTFGLQPGGMGTMIDARDRFLAPGGVLVPSRIQLLAAPVEAPDLYQKYVDVWRRQIHGLDLSEFRELAVEQRHPARVQLSQLIAPMAPIGVIDLMTMRGREFSGRAQAVATRSGTIHGVCGCFVSTLAEGIEIANVPGDSATTNFAQAFFPIDVPQRVAEGDFISIRIDSFDGETRWQVEIFFHDGRGPVRFDHNTFVSALVRTDIFHKRAHDYRPLLTARGGMERALFERFDGTSSRLELKKWFLEQFGDQLPSAREADAILQATIDRCG
jgi:SAM-dependent methyltransferase